MDRPDDLGHLGNRVLSVLYTVGHGNRSTEDLVAVLKSAEVGRLVDVRRHPGSSRNPHLSKPALENDLPAAGIAYEWWGEELGGRRKPLPDSPHSEWRNDSFRGYADYTDTPEFTEALVRLRERVEAGPNLAVMCAETLWWRCHRRLIADAFMRAGGSVVHLFDVGKTQAHPAEML